MEKIPGLYHYTSNGGLLGIIESSSLWFTKIDYLNDAEEYLFGMKAIAKILQNNYSSELFIHESQWFTSHVPTRPIFVFSLTEEGDLLSQWRAYCPNGGFSVCFNTSQIMAVVKENGFIFKRCIYSEVDLNLFVETEIVGMSSEEFQRSHKNDVVSQEFLSLRKKVVENTFLYCSFIKNKSFAEEKEWRILVPRDSSANKFDFFKYLKFRVRGTLIIPYLEIPASQNVSFNLVWYVRVGPGPNNTLLRDAAILLLKSPEAVLVSEIPYRPL